MTVFNIRTARLQSGDQFRDVKEVDLEPLELGGQRYVPIPESPEAALTLTRLSSGLMLELEFDVAARRPVRALPRRRRPRRRGQRPPVPGDGTGG